MNEMTDEQWFESIRNGGSERKVYKEISPEQAETLSPKERAKYEGYTRGINQYVPDKFPTQPYDRPSNYVVDPQTGERSLVVNIGGREADEQVVGKTEGNKGASLYDYVIPPEKQEEMGAVGEAAWIAGDVAKGVAKGATKGLEGLANTILDVAQVRPTLEELPERSGFSRKYGDYPSSDWEKYQNPVSQHMPDPEGAGGAIAQPIAQFLGAAGPAGKLLKALGVESKAVAGAVGDASAFNPEEEFITESVLKNAESLNEWTQETVGVNLREALPIISQMTDEELDAMRQDIFNYVEYDMEDSDFQSRMERRLYAAGEGSVIGLTFDGLIMGAAGILRFARKMKDMANEAPAPQPLGKMGRQRGAAAYHGSPHRFSAEWLVEMPDGSRKWVQSDQPPTVGKVIEQRPMGRFRIDKIGTGEGAQAYGHGLYFAENKGIAGGYRERLSDLDQDSAIEGVRALRPAHTESTASRVVGAFGNQKYLGSDDLKRIGIEPEDVGFEDAADEIAADNLVRRNFGADDYIKGVDVDGQPADVYRFRDGSAIADIGGEYKAIALDSGHIYEVDIPDEAIAKMLDWDAPLSEQPESVRLVAEEINMMGGVDYESMSREELIGILQKNDPNGVWTDEAAKIEGYEPITKNEALEYIRESEGFDDYLRTPLDLERDTGRFLYTRLVNMEGGTNGGSIYSNRAQELASAKLNELGIPGIRYFDGNSRSAGEGTRNIVVFDEDLVTIKSRNGEVIEGAERQQFLDDARPMDEASLTGDELITQHNLTEENLAYMDKRGGAPMPSIAVVKADNPLEGFGEISLFTDERMVKPTKKSNPVYSADAYTPREPRAEKFYTRTAKSKLEDYLLEPYGGEHIRDSRGQGYPDFGYLDLDDMGLDEALRGATGKARFLWDKGEMPDPAKFDSAAEWKEAVKNKANDYVDEFRQWRKGVEGQVGMNYHEKLFAGFTPSGRKRWVDASLDNSLKLMRKEIRGADGGANVYGAGALRAHLAPQFRTLKEIKDARGKIKSSDDVQAYKDAMNQKFSDLSHELGQYSRYKDSNPFSQSSMDQNRMAEIAAGESRFEDYYEYVPDELIREINDFFDELANGATDYFEGKPNRVVELDEFNLALVPEDASEHTIKTLERNGIKVETYKDKTDRFDKLKNYTNLMYSTLVGSVIAKGLYEADKEGRYQDEYGRWHDKSGKFIKAPEGS